MASWSEVSAAAPDLAGAVRRRFEAHGLGLVATLRADGFPRLSGVEPLFTDDEVWLGMMPGSRKGADLRRDPRLALHAATVDKAVVAGDAKLTGRGRLTTEDEAVARFRHEFAVHTGGQVPPGPFDLFLVDVVEVSLLTPGGDHLVIEWWREGGGVQRVKRR